MGRNTESLTKAIIAMGAAEAELHKLDDAKYIG